MFTVRSLLFITSVFAVSGCAPDRDLDAHKRDEQREKRIRAERVAGVYSGELSVTATKDVLGPMGLQLGTSSRPSDFETPRALLTGELVFIGATSVPINFTDGYFDPDDNSFVLSMDMRGPTDGGVARGGSTLSVSGRVEGDTIVGTISVIGESARTGSFTLTKRPEAKDVQGYMTNEEIRGSPVEVIQLDYNGTAVAGSFDYAVDLKINNVGSSVPDYERFANLFQRKKAVKATVNLGRKLSDGSVHQTPYTFTTAEWDPSTGLLEGVRAGGMRDVTTKLTCLPKNPVEPLGALDCQLLIDAEKSVTIDLSVTPVE